jgi:hypothetical protein
MPYRKKEDPTCDKPCEVKVKVGGGTCGCPCRLEPGHSGPHDCTLH